MNKEICRISLYNQPNMTQELATNDTALWIALIISGILLVLFIIAISALVRYAKTQVKLMGIIARLSAHDQTERNEVDQVLKASQGTRITWK